MLPLRFSHAGYRERPGARRRTTRQPDMWLIDVTWASVGALCVRVCVRVRARARGVQ